MTSSEATDAWLCAITAGDGELAWRLTEPAYRRVFARLWAEAWAERKGLDPDAEETQELILDLVDEGRDDRRWRNFAEAQRLRFANALPEELESWGGLEPRQVAPDCELVLLVDSAQLATEETDDAVGSRAMEDAFVPAVQLYMRRGAEGEWLLAGFNEFPPDWLELDAE